MATLLRHPNNKIYVYHWINSKTPVKASTKMSVDLKDWNDTTKQLKNSKLLYKGKSVKLELSKHVQAMEQAVVYLEANRITLTREAVKEQYLLNLDSTHKAKVSKVSIFDAFTQYVQANEMSEATAYNYTKTKRVLTALQLGKRDSNIATLSHSFYDAFIQHCNCAKMAKNTIKVHLSRITAVMHWTLKKNIHTNTAYQNYKYSLEETDSITLSEDEMQLFMNCEVPATMQASKDYFIAGYYTALRVSDWDRINLKLVDADGIFSIRSTKTGVTSFVPVSPVLMAILKRWNTEGQPARPHVKTLGIHLKAIAKLAGIKSLVSKRITKGGTKVNTVNEKYLLVTTHTARRSVATNLILQGVSPFIVMKITGHTTIESFSKYVRFQEIQAKLQLKDLDFFK